MPPSLPAPRHGPGQPLFFYPLREVGRRELGILCDHLQLPRAEGSTKEAAAGGGGPASRRKGESLNALAATFVEALLSQNPGSVSNIVGTVAKVQVSDGPMLTSGIQFGDSATKHGALCAALEHTADPLALSSSGLLQLLLQQLWGCGLDQLVGCS